MPQLEKIIAKGNRLTELMNALCTTVIGYRIYTGSEGKETDDASYCGIRAVEYLIGNHPGLRGVPQFVHECAEHPSWDCWQLVELEDSVHSVACEMPSAPKQ